MKLNDAVRKSLQRSQPERQLPMPRCNEGNAIPDQRRHDGDDELINRVLVKKGADDLTSAHHPDVLASFLTEPFGKGPDRLRDKFHADRRGPFPTCSWDI